MKLEARRRPGRFETPPAGNDFRASSETGPDGAGVLGLLATSALADAESAAYWAYHLGRTGFFLGAVRGGGLWGRAGGVIELWGAARCAVFWGQRRALRFWGDV